MNPDKIPVPDFSTGNMPSLEEFVFSTKQFFDIGLTGVYTEDCIFTGNESIWKDGRIQR